MNKNLVCQVVYSSDPISAGMLALNLVQAGFDATAVRDLESMETTISEIPKDRLKVIILEVLVGERILASEEVLGFLNAHTEVKVVCCVSTADQMNLLEGTGWEGALSEEFISWFAQWVESLTAIPADPPDGVQPDVDSAPSPTEQTRQYNRVSLAMCGEGPGLIGSLTVEVLTLNALFDAVTIENVDQLEQWFADPQLDSLRVVAVRMNEFTANSWLTGIALCLQAHVHELQTLFAIRDTETAGIPDLRQNNLGWTVVTLKYFQSMFGPFAEELLVRANDTGELDHADDLPDAPGSDSSNDGTRVEHTAAYSAVADFTPSPSVGADAPTASAGDFSDSFKGPGWENQEVREVKRHTDDFMARGKELEDAQDEADNKPRNSWPVLLFIGIIGFVLAFFVLRLVHDRQAQDDMPKAALAQADTGPAARAVSKRPGSSAVPSLPNQATATADLPLPVQETFTAGGEEAIKAILPPLPAQPPKLVEPRTITVAGLVPSGARLAEEEQDPAQEQPAMPAPQALVSSTPSRPVPAPAPQSQPSDVRPEPGRVATVPPALAQPQEVQAPAAMPAEDLLCRWHDKCLAVYKRAGLSNKLALTKCAWLCQPACPVFGQQAYDACKVQYEKLGEDGVRQVCGWLLL